MEFEQEEEKRDTTAANHLRQTVKKGQFIASPGKARGAHGQEGDDADREGRQLTEISQKINISLFYLFFNF